MVAGAELDSERVDVDSFLLGLRYLTQGEVTWIAEYYRNGAGYGAQELDAYYQFLETALDPGARLPLCQSQRQRAL